MPPLVYDVFVVGPSEPGPTAEARLCTTLATQSGRPVTAIAKALADKNLRVAHGVAREVAERIVREMLAYGAATAVTPSTATAPPTAVGRAPAGPPPVPAAFAPAAPSANGFSLAPLTGSRLDPPSGAFAPPPPSPSGPKAGAFTVPDDLPQDQELELAVREKPVPKAVPASGESSTAISSLGRPAYTLAGASALNTSKIVATSSASGLALSDDEADHTARCPTHGLLYDKRKSKGCRRCVEGRRSAHMGAGGQALRESPVKRAFLGFAVAFAIGLLPAVYYAKMPGAAEVTRLRAEQSALSERAGTDEILRRFDEIDGLVDKSHGKNMRNTLFIWVVTSSLAMAGFYRLT